MLNHYGLAIGNAPEWTGDISGISMGNTLVNTWEKYWLLPDLRKISWWGVK
jgi:hypothetical protein